MLLIIIMRFITIIIISYNTIIIILQRHPTSSSSSSSSSFQVYRGCLDHTLRLTAPCPQNAMSDVDDYGCCRVPFASIQLDHVVEKMRWVSNDASSHRVVNLVLLSDDPAWIVQQQILARVKYPW
jgi:hypothetical protein